MNFNNKRENIVLKLYCEFYIIANLIIGLLTIINYKSYGEAEGLILKLSRVDLMLILCLNIITYFFAYIFFYKTRNIRSFRGKIRIDLDHRKVHVIFMIITILQIIYTVYTGNGVVNAEVTSSKFDIIINALKISSFFPIYYVVCRDTSKRLYWFNIILYCFWQIICGWTGIILTIAFIELFLRIKHGTKSDFISKISKYRHLLLILLFVVGSYMYSYFVAIKNSIRYQYKFSKISWMDGMNKLLMRLSNFSVSVVGVQNHKIIASLYRNQNISNIELKSIFRPIFPGFLMDKNFRIIENEVIHSLYNDLSMGTSSEYNLFIKCFNLIESDFFEFVILSIVCIILFIFSKIIIDLFDTGTHDIDILYFLFILNISCGSSAESVFGYGYLGMIYMIPVLILLKAASIKIK